MISDSNGFILIMDQELSGPGGLTKINAGSTILSFVHTYTGDTNVNGGTLVVQGSIASRETFVNSGGVLSFSSFGGTSGNVSNRGRVSPGFSNPLGRPTVGGNYTQFTEGTLRIRMIGTGPLGGGPFELALLSVSGNANLRGTLEILPQDDFRFQRGDRFEIVTAGGGVNGVFSQVQNSSKGTILTLDVIYEPNAVVLAAVQGSFGALAGLTPNQEAIAEVLDRIVNDPAADPLIDFLDSELLEFLPNDFDLLAPEELTAMFEIGLSTANIQGYNIENRLDEIRNGSNGFRSTLSVSDSKGSRDLSPSSRQSGDRGGSKGMMEQATGPASPENRWGFFLSGSGEFVSVDSDFNSSGYDFQTGGATVGLDYRLTEQLAFGVTAGYANTSADLVNGGDISVDGGKLGLYGTWFADGVYINALVEGGLTNYETQRGALLGLAGGETEGGEFNGLLGGGYDWTLGNLTVGPIASLQYTVVDIDDFAETGSLAPLVISAQDEGAFRSRLGARMAHRCQIGNVNVRPEVRAEWKHDFSDDSLAIDSSFAGIANSSFTVRGPGRGEDSAVVGAGVSVQWSPSVLAFLNYHGEVGRENYDQHSVTGGVRISF